MNGGTPVAGGPAHLEKFTTCNSGVVGRGDQFQIEASLLPGPANQAMHEHTAQDPNAYWNPITSSVQGSTFPPAESPSIIRFPKHDQRVG